MIGDKFIKFIGFVFNWEGVKRSGTKLNFLKPIQTVWKLPTRERETSKRYPYGKTKGDRYKKTKEWEEQDASEDSESTKVIINYISLYY